MSGQIEICTEDELVQLTGRVRPSAQIRVLNQLGVDHVRRPDGRVLVHRDAVRQLLGLGARKSPDEQGPQPDWEALDVATQT
jgi:hypothetical protein